MPQRTRSFRAGGVTHANSNFVTLHRPAELVTLLRLAVSGPQRAYTGSRRRRALLHALAPARIEHSPALVPNALPGQGNAQPGARNARELLDVILMAGPPAMNGP